MLLDSGGILQVQVALAEGASWRKLLFGRQGHNLRNNDCMNGLGGEENDHLRIVRVIAIPVNTGSCNTRDLGFSKREMLGIFVRCSQPLAPAAQLYV